MPIDFSIAERNEKLVLPKFRIPRAQLAEPTREELLAPHSETKLPWAIPSGLMSEEDWNEFKLWLDDELSRAEAERTPYISKLARWEEAYSAPSQQKPKRFPLRNSSNLTIPVIKETVNILVAGLAQTTLTANPNWILEGLAPEWEPFTNDIERFLHIQSIRDIKFRSVMQEAILEAVKFGTAVVESGYKYDRRHAYGYSPNGKKVYKRNVAVSDGPGLWNIPLEDVWIRAHETNFQDARWCGKMLRLSGRTLIEGAANGEFENVQELAGFTSDDLDEVKSKQQLLEEWQSVYREQYNIFKIWAAWDVDGDGKFEEICVYYERDRRILLGQFFNHYWHGKRPLHRLVFFPKRFFFYGEGVCQQAEDLQKEITTQHNQRIDATSMSILKMLVKRKGVTGIQPGDPLYTGKVIEALDIWNDIRELNLSDPPASTIANEQMARQILERVTGVSEASSRAMPVTRTTATAQLALLQEQAKRFDLSVTNIRDMQTEIGQFILELDFQFGTNGKATSWLGERGRVVDAVFRLPRRIIELGLAIRASAPTSQQNLESRRQGSLALFNLMVQLYERFLPMAAQLAPQALPYVAHALVTSAKKFMFRTLAAFEEPDPEEVLAGLSVLERVLPAPEDLGGLASFERAEETAQILSKLGGLEALLDKADRDAEGLGNLRLTGPESRRVETEEGILRGNGAGARPSRAPPGGL